MSEPRVVAPALIENGSWPHVEGAGRLCLAPSRLSADAGNRVLYLIGCAKELLNFDKPSRKSEFQREFATYWQRGAATNVGSRHWSLVKPDGPSREVWCASSPKRKITLWADSKDALVRWFENTGHNLEANKIRRKWCAWLNEPITPQEFPSTGARALEVAAIPDATLERLAQIGKPFPLLFGSHTVGGPVFGVAEIAATSTSGMQRRRSLAHASATTLRNRIADVAVTRSSVTRLDAQYVHGRDHNKDIDELQNASVAFVGCGALGSSVVRLLAQAGVGQLILIDGDILTSHNTSRHALGNTFLGYNKAEAMRAMLRRDFPHIAPPLAYSSRVEDLSDAQWEGLARCDLIVSAGIDYLGDTRISRWRRDDMYARPYHVSTWVEAFALAGHAVSLFEDRDISAIVDEDGRARYELVRWADKSQYELSEAGCGNTFQPHGAVELQRTAVVAARLCLDILLNKSATSTRRAWLGDRNDVVALGGELSAAFDQSNVEKTLPWPPDAPTIDS